MGIELNLLLLLVGGFGFLYLRYRFRTNRRRMLAARRGYYYALRGLEELPVELQETVLFTTADGGHERDVMSGNQVIADVGVPVHIFTFRFQRDVRGETAVMMLRPPFRLTSPTTVISYQLPRAFPHIVIKRCGRADDIRELLDDAPRNLTAVAREASGIDRIITVDPPAGLDRAPLTVAHLGDDYRVWTAGPEIAGELLDRATCDYLRSAAAGEGEWVIELLGPLLLVYDATDGALGDDDVLAMAEFTDELCRRILRASQPLTPRGVEAG